MQQQQQPLQPPAQHQHQLQGSSSTPKPHFVKICELRPASGNVVNTIFIILEKQPATRVNEAGAVVCQALVADATASAHMLLWGAEVEHLQPGHIVSLTNGIFSYHKNVLVLRAGKKGSLEKIGEFCMQFVETPNMSRLQWVQDPNNPKHWVPAGGPIPRPQHHHHPHHHPPTSVTRHSPNHQPQDHDA